MVNWLGRPAPSQRCQCSVDEGIFARALHARGGRGFRIGAAKLRMVTGAMVAFRLFFPDELPVALFDDGVLVRHLRFMQAVRQHVGGLGGGAEGGKIRRSSARQMKM